MSVTDTPTGNVVQGEMAYLDNDGNPSSIGTPQIRTDHYHKKALIELRNQQYFGPLADTMSMPKHMGKAIKLFHYFPVLDDRNDNDQGIDAAGAIVAKEDWRLMTPAGVLYPAADAAAAYETEALAVAAATTNATGQTAFLYSGGLYGSSKDVGVITSKLPALTEHGGRVNRIGYTRIVVTGSIIKRGFFSEYTQESLDFDTDAELMSHITQESLVAANEMTEDDIQKDLLNGVGITRYGGVASSNVTITGHGTDPSVLTYSDLLHLAIDLDNNKCPKSTKIITGSRMIDTKVINAARYLYCGSELIPTFEAMTDLHDERAFRSVETYAAAGTIANGEIGSVGQFRIIVVPEMMKYAGGGAAAGAGNVNGFYETGAKYDVFPLLVVGSGCFTTIGFQTDGKTVKFKIIHKKPGYETATALDPYGEKGHYAIKWYYGSMILRPEWLAVMKVAAQM